MLLASPLWLLALGPWLAVVIWLLSGSHQRVPVPFLELWRAGEVRPQSSRHLHVPPLAIALALLSLLLAILAAAHPRFRLKRARMRDTLTIILDRGITMSASTAGVPRYRELADQVAEEMRRRFIDCNIDLLILPGEKIQSLNLDQFTAQVARLSPTALDTRQLLTRSVASTHAPTLVISDQPTSDSVIAVAPDEAIEDIAITAIAAREGPHPQLMIRLRNQSKRSSVTLRTSFDNQNIEQRLDLPPAPGEKNYFINFSGTGSELQAELLPHDDLPTNDFAWLAREQISLRVQPRFAIPAELRRLIDAYDRSRAVKPISEPLAMVQDVADLPKDSPGVVLAGGQGELKHVDVEAADHPVTHHVNWQKLPFPLHLAPQPPRDWNVIVHAGLDALVAVSPSAPNRVWIGFDSPRWSTTTDYVIFWTNVFDWAGGGGADLSYHRTDEWTSQWKPTSRANVEFAPGLYRRDDGAMRAFNAPDVPIPTLHKTDWREKIAALVSESARFDAAPWLLILAILFLVASALFWRSAIAPTSPIPAVPPGRELPRR